MKDEWRMADSRWQMADGEWQMRMQNDECRMKKQESDDGMHGAGDVRSAIRDMP